MSPHPEVLLHSQHRTKTKANLAIIISAIAGVVSLGSLLVSVLANLDKIISNLEILNDLLF